MIGTLAVPDAMEGGLGDDTYYVYFPQYDVIIEKDGEGTDVVIGTGTLPANIENMQVTSSGTGNAFANLMTGDDYFGNRLDGAGGSDTLIGGKGNDTYVIDELGDVIVELAGEGRDTLDTYISYKLPANLDVLVLLGNAAIDGYANNSGCSIFGNDEQRPRRKRRGRRHLRCRRQ